jgi:hypothetical protein
MRRLKKPDLLAGDVYTSCISEIEAAPVMARFKLITAAVLELAQQYEVRAAMNELYTFPASQWGNVTQVVIGTVTKGELVGLYSDFLAKRGRLARSYYDRLMLLAPLGKCPYCGFGHVSTLDHFLSKARYPSFSVLPFNLVPSCADCNLGKGAPELNAGNQIPHPYYEVNSIEIDAWLFASVEPTIPVSVTYRVNTPGWWPVDLAARVENYFRDLKLAPRFSVEAASEMISLSDYLAQFPAHLIKTHLQNIAEIERAKRKNSWKAALYEALAASHWYCEGGWRPMA